MSAIALQSTDTLGYLASLFKPGDWIDIQGIHQTHTWADEHGVMHARVRDNFLYVDSLDASVLDKFSKAQEEGWNIYVGMNAFTPGLNRRRKKDVKQVRSVYIEFDENGDTGLQSILFDKDVVPEPHFILQSSLDKYYVIWLVKDFTVDQQEALNSALQKRYGSDPASVDAARVLRLPGTRNLKPKYNPTPTVMILEQSNHPRYSLSDFKIDLNVKQQTPIPAIASEKLSGIVNKVLANLDQAAIQYSVEPYDNGFKIDLEECLWGRIKDHHQNGNPGDAAVFIDESGRLGYHCFHTYCAENYHWKEFREELERRAGHKLSFDDSSEILVRGEPIEKRAQAAKQKERFQQQANQEVLETVTADKVQSKRITYLWGQRIPQNKVCVFAGNPDQCKSLVSDYVMARVTVASPLYGDSEAQIPASEVLLMAAEDDPEDTIRPRLEAAGANLSRVHILMSIIKRDGAGNTLAEREAQLDTDISFIKRKVVEHPEIRLVVIDPISSYLGKANMNREQEVRQVLTPLKVLAAECKVTILLIMHLNKSSDQEAIHRIGGAVAFTGVARAVWLFTKAKDDDGNEDPEKYLMLRVKNNLARPTGGLTYKVSVRSLVIEGQSTAVPYVEFIGETDQKVATVFANGKPLNGRPPVKRQDGKQWLLGFLSKNGLELATDVEKCGRREGHTLATLRRLKEELFVDSKKVDGRWYWCAPDLGPETKESKSVAVTF